MNSGFKTLSLGKPHEHHCSKWQIRLYDLESSKQ
jgi:hypothetical protein